MPEQPKTLVAALVEVQARLPRIEKSKTADVRTKDGSYQYSYADLTAITEALLPLLTANGLAWVCKPTLNTEGKMVLAYALKHVSGEQETGEYPLPASGSPQQLGSAISYGRRYCITAVTGLAPADDDDDGQAAEQQGTAQRRPPAQRRKAEQPAGGRTAQRATRPAADPPPLPGDDDPGKISKPQLAKLGVVFSKAGIVERDERLAIVRGLLDLTDLTSSTELTKEQASRLIDALDRAEQHPDGLLAGLAQSGGDQ